MRDTAKPDRAIQTIYEPACSLLMTPKQIAELMKVKPDFGQASCLAMDIIDKTAEELLTAPYPDKAFEIASYMIRDPKVYQLFSKAVNIFLRSTIMDRIEKDQSENG